MKKKYEIPEMEVINFEVQNVICTSGDTFNQEDTVLPDDEF